MLPNNFDKPILYSCIIILAIVIIYLLLRPIPIETKIVTSYKIVEKKIKVAQVVDRETIKYKDGAIKIIEKIRTEKQVVSKEESKVIVKPQLTKYSLGVSTDISKLPSLLNLEVGIRIQQFPVFLTVGTSLTVNKELKVNYYTIGLQFQW